MKVKVIDQRETAEEASSRKVQNLKLNRLGGLTMFTPNTVNSKRARWRL